MRLKKYIFSPISAFDQNILSIFMAELFNTEIMYKVVYLVIQAPNFSHMLTTLINRDFFLWLDINVAIAH